MGAGSWAELDARMKGCERCPLAATRAHVVTYRGAEHPWLLFVGEAPGRQEDERGVPFVGRAGQILDRAIAASGLVPEEWGVTNVIMCRPPGNVFDRKAAEACRPWLEAKISTLAPRVLVTLGAHALGALLPEALPISSARGRVHRAGDRILFPLLHPASTVRRRAFADGWAADWGELSRHLSEWRAAAGTMSPPRQG